MMYTMFLRDERGEEVKIAELVTSNILHSTVLLCPKERRLTSIDADILRRAFERAGVYAIICNEPVQLYQLKPSAEVPA